MTGNRIFVDRRKGLDRRLDADPCQNLPLDLYHRMRRKNSDRRNQRRSLADDYYAYLQAVSGPRAAAGDAGHN